MDMGFAREHCVEALMHSSNLEQATEYILTHPPPVTLPPPQPAAPAPVADAAPVSSIILQYYIVLMFFLSELFKNLPPGVKSSLDLQVQCLLFQSMFRYL